MQKIEQAILSRVQRRFTELRDELLATSQDLAKSEKRPTVRTRNVNIAASKQIVDLCQAVLMAGGRDENEQLHRSSVDRERRAGLAFG